MISLGFIDRELAVEGTELVVLWGNADRRQHEVRVKVARFPYIQVVRNDKLDVEAIPHFAG